MDKIRFQALSLCVVAALMTLGLGACSGQTGNSATKPKSNNQAAGAVVYPGPVGKKLTPAEILDWVTAGYKGYAACAAKAAIGAPCTSAEQDPIANLSEQVEALQTAVDADFATVKQQLSAIINGQKVAAVTSAYNQISQYFNGTNTAWPMYVNLTQCMTMFANQNGASGSPTPSPTASGVAAPSCWSLNSGGAHQKQLPNPSAADITQLQQQFAGIALANSMTPNNPCQFIYGIVGSGTVANPGLLGALFDYYANQLAAAENSPSGAMPILPASFINNTNLTTGNYVASQEEYLAMVASAYDSENQTQNAQNTISVANTGCGAKTPNPYALEAQAQTYSFPVPAGAVPTPATESDPVTNPTTYVNPASPAATTDQTGLLPANWAYLVSPGQTPPISILENLGTGTGSPKPPSWAPTLTKADVDTIINSITAQGVSYPAAQKAAGALPSNGGTMLPANWWNTSANLSAYQIYTCPGGSWSNHLECKGATPYSPAVTAFQGFANPVPGTVKPAPTCNVISAVQPGAWANGTGYVPAFPQTGWYQAPGNEPITAPVAKTSQLFPISYQSGSPQPWQFDMNWVDSWNVNVISAAVPLWNTQLVGAQATTQGTPPNPTLQGVGMWPACGGLGQQGANMEATFATWSNTAPSPSTWVNQVIAKNKAAVGAAKAAAAKKK